MKKLLWLDDYRDPKDTETDWMVFSCLGRDVEIHWVKNYDEFVNYIKQNGLPDGINFDHDLEGSEMWKDVEDYKGLYKISTYGRVLSLPRNTTKGGILKPTKTLSGLVVNLRNCKNNTKTTIHRLLSKAFIPNPKNKKQVNHKDGNRWNNHINNLEWVTPSENVKHSHDKLKRNFYAFAENHKNSKTVSKYTKGGIYICTYGSTHEAGRVNNIFFTNIAKNCRGERKSAGGFMWKYDNRKVTIKNNKNFIKKKDRDYISRFHIPKQKHEKTGYHCAKWLIGYCMDNKKELPTWSSHSANPVGRDNINNILFNFKYKR